MDALNSALLSAVRERINRIDHVLAETPWHRKNGILIGAVCGLLVMATASFLLAVGPVESIAAGVAAFLGITLLLFPISPAVTLAGFVGLGINPATFISEIQEARLAAEEVKSAATLVEAKGLNQLAETLRNLSEEIETGCGFIEKHPVRYRSMRVDFVERISQSRRIVSNLVEVKNAGALLDDKARVIRGLEALSDALRSSRLRTSDFNAAQLDAALEVLESDLDTSSSGSIRTRND